MNKRFDYIFLISAVVIIIFGLLILASVSAVFSQEKVGSTTYYLLHQIYYGFFPAIIFAFIVYKIPLGFIKKYAGIFILVNLLLMILTFIPGMGISAGGASRWLNLKFFSFQPSETLKLVFIAYLAAWLASPARVFNKKSLAKKIKSNADEGRESATLSSALIPFLVIVSVIAALLIGQSDATTLGIAAISAFVMYFSASTPVLHMIIILLLGAGALFALVKIEPYRLQRILVFWNPSIDPMGIGYQLKQALIAVGSGGIFGLGLGMSVQKFGFIPHPMSDSIFAILAEETGFLGSLILVILFSVFAWGVFKIAKESQDKFSRYFSVGFGSWICLQAFINIGAMIGVFPLSGVPLPLISYGGSHLIAEIVGIGIMLNILRENKKSSIIKP